MQGGFIPRFCCNKYLGCLSYFIAFKVYNSEDIRQVSFVDNTKDSQIDLKSLTCINRRSFRWFFIHALDYRGYVLVIPPLMCYGPSYQLFVVSKLYSVCHNKLLKVCSLNRNVCMGFEA